MLNCSSQKEVQLSREGSRAVRCSGLYKVRRREIGRHRAPRPAPSPRAPGPTPRAQRLAPRAPAGTPPNYRPDPGHMAKWIFEILKCNSTFVFWYLKGMLI